MNTFGILEPNIDKVWQKITISLILFFIQSYKFNMSCVDDAGHFLHSDQLEFSTRHLSSLRSTKINENNNQNRDSSSHNQHSGHHSSFISKSDYLTEMNLKLLPAISNSIQQQSSGNTANIIGSDDPIKVSTSSLSRSYYTKKTSPHAVLGNFEINLKVKLQKKILNWKYVEVIIVNFTRKFAQTTGKAQ